MKIVIGLLMMFASVSAFAAKGSVHSCEGLDSIGNLIGNVKSFSNGAIRVAYVSTEEPAAAPDHLLVFVYGEEMSVTCSAISQENGSGFSGVEFNKMSAKYEAGKGLLLQVPVSVYDHEAGSSRPDGVVKIRINQKAEKPVTLE